MSDVSNGRVNVCFHLTQATRGASSYHHSSQRSVLVFEIVTSSLVVVSVASSKQPVAVPVKSLENVVSEVAIAVTVK